MNVKKTPSKRQVQSELAIRELAMAYPEAQEDFPWGERAIKVAGKVFLFLSYFEERVALSVKLPVSSTMALMLPFASPTGYGLGRSGWVSARFDADEEIPLDVLASWIDESYRAIAPKKLVAQLARPAKALPSDELHPKPAKPKKTAPRKPVLKKAASKTIVS